MVQQSGRSSIRQNGSNLFLFAVGCALCISACKPPSGSKQIAHPGKPLDLAAELAASRTDAAADKLKKRRPDEALPLLVSALKAAPDFQEAHALAETILRQTTWNFPDLTIHHPHPIEQVASAPPSSLWVGLGPQTNTTARWNLETLQIESSLFPRADCVTRSLVFDRLHQFLVVERGGVNLLCNARTLKPIRDLGTLPPDLTPASVIVFSDDGLLMAHPEQVSSVDPAIVWHLRDTGTGQIIRSSEPISPSAPQPLAAFLSRLSLQVLKADGTLFEMPVSPVEPTVSTPLDEPATMLHAQFSSDGNAALTLIDQGPHQGPVRSILSYGEENDGSLDAAALARRFPWNHQPNLWNSLMRDAESASFFVKENTLTFATLAQAAVITNQRITALAFSPSGLFTAQDDGALTFHRFLPLPTEASTNSGKANLTPKGLLELEKLTRALTAIQYDEHSRSFQPLSPPERQIAIGACDPAAIRAIFPLLDFTDVFGAFEKIQTRKAEPGALQPLLDRLSQSSPISEPPAALVDLEEIFRNDDTSAVLAAIQTAGKSGILAAHALAISLRSEKPEWIEACLNQAENLPPLLRQIALSRIAWLKGRKADALSAWPEIFPDLASVRLREDWHGWEQADFQPALDNIRDCVRGELDAIEVPKDSTPEQRRAIAARLLDRATLTAVGPRRFSDACLKAALAFSAYKDETETTFKLASLARNMGAPPEPCLRAEALALTGSGDSTQAHPRWIELITEHPVATHLPGDYAEAAYTAFENSDPRQAMEILTTGMHRFPNDGNFALRAGWVALLTGNSERAYRFLREGQRIGFPEEKLENGTALLAIAASLTGATDDAAVYFQDLLRIDPAWADPATLETLDWPEDLKSVLGQFTPGL